MITYDRLAVIARGGAPKQSGGMLRHKCHSEGKARRISFSFSRPFALLRVTLIGLF
jgi:hypothetical protein